jgi:glycosyltransferase involved in cell wall biosynthesis
LFEKAKSQLVTRPKSYIGEAKLIRAILKAHEQENIVLVIDHHLGGGANHYRDRLVAQKIADGATVFIFSYHVATLSHILVVRNKRLNERYAIPGSEILLELASQAVIKEIIYNNAVSFAKPESIPQFIVALKNQSNARLILLVHDFFMACPSYTLLDDRGAFCGIPDDTTCQKCLRKNEQGFATLFAARDIQQWRVMWQVAIACADEVRAFSKSSVQLMTKAYPEMDLSRVVVKPHELGYLPAGPVYPSYTAALRIGVVGGISYHKGVRFVEDLSQEIKRRGLEIQIVIIGTIETACDPSVVRQTGPYRHDQLPSLIQASGANIMLFPSIWPETFSYVVHELVELELPVACFDMGAQAECIADYAKGLILGEPNASAILDDLVAFHQRTYLSS